MKEQEIRQLLERYYAGNTTLEEEGLLKEYFGAGGVPEEFAGEREIFRYYSRSQYETDIPEPSPDFEKRISAAIDREAERESVSVRKRLYIAISGMAAAVLILSAAYFFFERRSDIRDTYSDPEVAYTEAMKILYGISVRMNEGTKALGQLEALQEKTGKTLNAVEKSASLIEDNMKPLEELFSSLGASGKNKE
ncbi:MAG: hypothetical protein ACOXZU_13680 [Bacteroidales bacterium]|jgi:hypothetical protein